VQFPNHLVSGTYYLIPWTDPYDVVPEDTLAVNINPDDPNEIDNNNYKAGVHPGLGTDGTTAIGTTIVATTVPNPDLVVTSVTAPAQALGGETFTVSWTVNNKGKGPAGGSWVDEVWLTDDPNTTSGLRLGQVSHDGGLDSKGTYTGTLTVTLSPSARG